jgi:hypothetical protein
MIFLAITFILLFFFILLFLNEKKMKRSYLIHQPIFINFALDICIKHVIPRAKSF